MSEESIPGWDDLLPSLNDISQHMGMEEVEKIASASENVLTCLQQGIAAIGAAIVSGVTNKNLQLEEHHVCALGWLVESLGEVVERIRC